jgi:hypothetical protein
LDALLIALVELISGEVVLTVTPFKPGMVMIGALSVGVGIISFGVELFVVVVLVLNEELFSKLLDEDGFGRISLGFLRAFKGVELTGANKLLLAVVVVAEAALDGVPLRLVVLLAEVVVVVCGGAVVDAVVNEFELVLGTTGTSSDCKSAVNGCACFLSVVCF